MKDRSLKALNGHLHDQLERILNPDLAGDNLDMEIKRTKVITDISKNIIEGEKTVNERARIIAEHAPLDLVNELMPKVLNHAG